LIKVFLTTSNFRCFISNTEYMEILPVWARHSRRSWPTSSSLHFRLRWWRRWQKDAAKGSVDDLFPLLCLSPSSYRIRGPQRSQHSRQNRYV
jgi:hypothetical protein